MWWAAKQPTTSSFHVKIELYDRRSSQGNLRRRRAKPGPSKRTAVSADLMPIWKNYYLARSVEDALQALASAQGPALPIAGGTDLLLDLQQGRHAPVDTLVDLNAIPEMTVIELRTAALYIGAAAPLRLLAELPLVKQHAQALVEACGQVGGPQVRNAATLGGNVAHALPAADGSIALTALDAQAEVATAPGGGRVPIGELYRGPGRSALEAGREIVVGFYLPLSGNGQASAFQRVMRPQGVALPVLNMALWLSRDGETLAMHAWRLARPGRFPSGRAKPKRCCAGNL